MKYLESTPIVFGSTGNENYEAAWERIHNAELRRDKDGSELDEQRRVAER